MKLRIDDEFREICHQILRGVAAGRIVDSDDIYQSPNFCGGWDENEGRFGFSFYAPDGGDYIFSFSLEDARSVAEGGVINPQLEYWKQAPDW
ncbi:MAG TPA: hypothetical protein VFF69_08560 [Phycisphaerales bacterium]|nr:hypothetical protein [Phycisphaerales bacterium]